MNGDREYFERYFSVCELLAEKQLLNNRLWEGDRNGLLSGDHFRSRRQIDVLNELILEEEIRLRKEVLDAQDKGVVFAFESFALKRQLMPFDRRLVLFFLHLDLFRGTTCSMAFERRDLAGILDCEGTPESRSNALLDIFPGSTLFKKKIISPVCSSQVRLAVPLRDMLRKLVSGQKRKIPRQKHDREDTDDNDSTDVGRICSPEYKLEDVVLSPEKMQEILLHVDTHERMSKIGAMKNMHRGKGLGMLFYGPPGTGKSMLAHGIAAHAKKKVLQVSVSQVLSKWVGEAEKNIVSIFKIAKEKGCVVCLDEADSLISSREGAVRSWEMSQANVFLEELEKFEGIFIMTTNMETRLDPALERRLALRVKFDIPLADVREKIWRNHIPSSIKYADDVNWAYLGRKYEFSGGYIKNAALSAIRHMLARNGEGLSMNDLLSAAQKEQDGMFLNGNKGQMGFVAA